MNREILSLFLFGLLILTVAACDSGGNEDSEPLPVPRVVAEEDYVVTDSGLKYYDFEVGEGPIADTDSLVSVHYNGWFTNGILFDSSVLRGRPIEFILGRGMVIDGWEEGIRGMQVGGQRQLVIPPELGYGASGSPSIPPNTTLVFEVELVGL